jgi:hypothetical protein
VPLLTLKVLAVRRARLAQKTRDLNALVLEASMGRAHHQPCMLGGLWTGMASAWSGAPCWCGCDGWSDK